MGKRAANFRLRFAAAAEFAKFSTHLYWISPSVPSPSLVRSSVAITWPSVVTRNNPLPFGRVGVNDSHDLSVVNVIGVCFDLHGWQGNETETKVVTPYRDARRPPPLESH
jgi:hypothetical protein